MIYTYVVDHIKMSKKARMTVSLEPEVHQKLVERAKQEGRTPGNLASFLLSLSIEKGLNQIDAKSLADVHQR